MSLLQINTAIPLVESLLESHVDQRSSQSTTTRSDVGSRTKFIVLGLLTGFFIQVVSLGAYTFLLLNFRGSLLNDSGRNIGMTALAESGIFRNATPFDGDDSLVENKTILYTILSVLTQIDLIVYVLIWVGFTCTMTNNGISCIRSTFFSTTDDGESKSQNNPVIKRRSIFVLGVHFLVGIVIGAFGAWLAIDLFYGFPIPFQPILSTVAIDLVLCYLMVWCYDLGGKKKRRREGRTDEQEEEIKFLNYYSDEDEDPAMCC